MGASYICDDLKVLGVDLTGGMQEYWAVPCERLVRVPDSFSDDHAAVIEPLAVATHDVRRAGVKAEDTVLVFGGGPIGPLIALVCRHRGARVAVAEVNSYRVEMFGKLGLETVGLVHGSGRHSAVHMVSSWIDQSNTGSPRVGTNRGARNVSGAAPSIGGVLSAGAAGVSVGVWLWLTGLPTARVLLPQGDGGHVQGQPELPLGVALVLGVGGLGLTWLIVGLLGSQLRGMPLSEGLSRSATAYLPILLLLVDVKGLFLPLGWLSTPIVIHIYEGRWSHCPVRGGAGPVMLGR